MTTIYTVGHSRHTALHFAELLRAQEIRLLVDVRSQPASRWSLHFGRAALTQRLAADSVAYVFLGRELGGRPVGTEFYRPDGSVDYARRSESPDFKAGIEQLAALGRERKTAILCAEEDPSRCHRRLLVAPALQHLGIHVVHLRGDGRLETESTPQLALLR